MQKVFSFRYFALIAMVAMAALMFTACGSSEEKAAEEPAAVSAPGDTATAPADTTNFEDTASTRPVRTPD